jgi:hypothetical protein
MKKIKPIKNALIFNQNFICGSFFYAIEYLDYLLKNNLKIQLLLSNFFKKYFEFLIKDKYDSTKLHPDLFKNILFFNQIKSSFLKIENLIILDTYTFMSLEEQLNKTIFFKNLFYNYGNDKSSLYKKFSFKQKNKINNFLIFGDKEIGCKVDYHYPLCLNFEIFKEIKNFENNIWSENSKNINFQPLEKRTQQNFHKKFNTLKYIKNENFWERANRLIPECKFYNKKIIFESKSYIDSAQLRYERDWQDYCIWRFKSPDTGLTFADWIKGFQ